MKTVRRNLKINISEEKFKNSKRKMWSIFITGKDGVL
jgi:hypothetical protein